MEEWLIGRGDKKEVTTRSDEMYRYIKIKHLIGYEEFNDFLYVVW